MPEPVDLLTRRADTRPASWNGETRTIEAVLSTGAAVARRDARGPFLERLDLDAIDPASLAGVPVLDGHRQTGSEHAVGVIVEARREGSALIGTIRLSAAADVASVAAKVAEGVLRGISVGYRVSKFTDSQDATTRQRVNTMSREEILHRALHTTSDFPNLLTAAGNRVLLPSYMAAASPLKRLARKVTAADFRPVSQLKVGNFDKLAKVGESGEIQATTTAESVEGYRLETFGRLFGLSRQAIVNDDLNAFGRWNMMMGQAAAETEADQLVTLLTQSNGTGPVMQETGSRLFHANHFNLAGVAGAPSIATLSAGRLAMRTQKGLNRKTPINVTPKFLVVGPDLETTAEKVVAELRATTVDDQNPFSGKLELMVEARLPATAWYIFADPAMIPVLEYAYLSSAQGPQLSSRDGWEVLGREFRVTLDFGCGAVDYRGAYRNAGA